MLPNNFKNMLYERNTNLSILARRLGLKPSDAHKVVIRWYGKVGNPRGKTRELLKLIEAEVGASIYREAK